MLESWSWRHWHRSSSIAERFNRPYNK
jgi:hypothetical protein